MQVVQRYPTGHRGNNPGKGPSLRNASFLPPAAASAPNLMRQLQLWLHPVSYNEIRAGRSLADMFCTIGRAAIGDKLHFVHECTP